MLLRQPAGVRVRSHTVSGNVSASTFGNLKDPLAVAPPRLRGIKGCHVPPTPSISLSFPFFVAHPTVGTIWTVGTEVQGAGR